jgi:hypothetical protein
MNPVVASMLGATRGCTSMPIFRTQGLLSLQHRRPRFLTGTQPQATHFGSSQRWHNWSGISVTYVQACALGAFAKGVPVPRTLPKGQTEPGRWRKFWPYPCYWNCEGGTSKLVFLHGRYMQLIVEQTTHQYKLPCGPDKRRWTRPTSGNPYEDLGGIT